MVTSATGSAAKIPIGDVAETETLYVLVNATLSPLAGNPVPSDLLVDVSRLIATYYDERPDPAVSAQQEGP